MKAYSVPQDMSMTKVIVLTPRPRMTLPMLVRVIQINRSMKNSDIFLFIDRFLFNLDSAKQ